MIRYDPARLNSHSWSMRDDPACFYSLAHGACGMISAIILAAGESRRMGQPKMLLPWGKTTVLGQVISIFKAAGVEDIVVIVGGVREQVEEIVNQQGARSIFNSDFKNGEMLPSLQRGLEAQSPQMQATLIGLGDQPQVQEGTVRLVCETYMRTQAQLVVPSHQMRRGHPWLVERSLWSELLAMRPPQSARDFLNRHAEEIQYVQVQTASILADLDTLEEYKRARP
jgi:molybdenum cofactor cytidylyltransferase